MWIKICGIRDVDSALAAAACGIQAVGLNFYDRSPRAVAPETAAEIVSRLPAGVEPVGVFVNHPLPEIRQIASACKLATVQLHGDEPPETIAALRGLHVIRAFRVGSEGLPGVAEYLERCHTLGAMPWACLIDAKVEGAYGGTGQTAHWETISAEYRGGDWPPLILAGGLRPDNVAQAIAAVHPWGVDVAGGVESSLACKDAALVRKFVGAARAAQVKP